MRPPEVVYGPPGCGKTTYLLEQMAELKRSGLKADEIGFVAFTKAAAAEALSRLGVTRSKTVRTLHSLCYEIAGVSREQVVDDDKLVEFSELIGYPLTGRTLMSEGQRTLGDELMEFHTYSRALDIPVIEAWERTQPDLDPALCEMFSETYSDWKAAFGYVDFNDMLDIASRMSLDIGVKHLFVDEGQDLSPLQWRVVRGLLGHVGSSTVAGDDDQAIYTWAGADAHGMASLGGDGHVLSQSHRVPRSAHALAGEVIHRVNRRVPKKYAPRKENGQVVLAHGLQYVDAPTEDTLVLYRNHSSRAEAEAWLIENRVPYTMLGAVVRSAFEDRYANAVRAFLTLKAGNEVSRNQVAVLQKVARSEWRQDIGSGQFRALLSRPWEDVLDIPWDRMRYLASVDLFKRPLVRMSTIHSAKGMEADSVLLMNEMGERTQEGMGDDEHRVWYVALTRTRKSLTIVSGDCPYDIPWGAHEVVGSEV